MLGLFGPEITEFLATIGFGAIFAMLVLTSIIIHTVLSGKQNGIRKK